VHSNLLAPTRNNRKSRANKRQPRNKRKPQPKRKQGLPRSSLVARLSAMTRDPCNAPLQGGTYGTVEGVVSRCHSSNAFDLFNTEGFGYMAWVPQIHGRTYGAGAINWGLVRYYPGASGLAADDVPLNSAINAWGGQADGYGYGLEDPAFTLVNTDLVSDARTLAACMEMHTTGKAQDNHGEVAVLTNLTLRDFMDDTNTGVLQLSVNSAFNASTRVARLGMGKVEALFTPPEVGTFSDEDTTYTQYGTNGTNPSLVGVAGRTFNPQVIVIAWRNVTTTMPVTFNFTKIIEWRPKTIGTIGHIQPSVLSTSSNVGNIQATLTNAHGDAWDQKVPENEDSGWASGVYQAASKLATRAGRTVIRNGLSAYARRSDRRGDYGALMHDGL